MKKAVVFLLAMLIILQLGTTAMAVTSTPEVVVTSTESSQSVLREIRHETPFTGNIGYTEQVYTYKAEVFTSNYSWFKECGLADKSYWNTSQYSVTVEFSIWAMRSAWGNCYLDKTMSSARDATLRMWI